MNRIFFLSLALLVTLTGCGGLLSGSDASQPKTACTSMASFSSIFVQVRSTQAMSQNLGVVINGKSPEMVINAASLSSERFLPPIFVSGDGHTAYLSMRYSEEDFRYVFQPDPSSGPLPAIKLDLYFGGSLFRSVESLPVTWRPQYANGHSCGVTGYDGDAAVTFE